MIALIPLLFAINFGYHHAPPLDVHVQSTGYRDGAEIRDITFASTTGAPTAAYLVVPEHPRGRGPAVLFVHWYEPDAPDSNRTQFLRQAAELARDIHATSLLIETMWSDPKWFKTRNSADDYSNSIRQVKELRRALDLLTAQPAVDPKRIAYVGHDFGAMYGAVLAGVDHRPKAWALQAGTTSFSLWYLLGTKLDPAARQAVIDRLAPLDPVKYIGKAAPAPILFQFGTQDPYVPGDRAQAFVNAANEPKTVKYYEAGHNLNDQAIADRQAWLKKIL